MNARELMQKIEKEIAAQKPPLSPPPPMPELTPEQKKGDQELLEDRLASESMLRFGEL